MADIVNNIQRSNQPIRQVGPYTRDEFLDYVSAFHHYTAPGVIIGGIMVSIAIEQMPEGVLYNALSETVSCLPDSIQLLTPCTIGNSRLRIINLGRYAISLYDKDNGNGVRIYLDPEKLQSWDEIQNWILKLKTRREQDSEKLLEQIWKAGHDIYTFYKIQIKPEYLTKYSKGAIGICRLCGEAYPVKDGEVCLGCQGEAPYDIVV
jgi:formylmethanofuran dehydrogenase subunit E